MSASADFSFALLLTLFEFAYLAKNVFIVQDPFSILMSSGLHTSTTSYLEAKLTQPFDFLQLKSGIYVEFALDGV